MTPCRLTILFQDHAASGSLPQGVCSTCPTGDYRRIENTVDLSGRSLWLPGSPVSAKSGSTRAPPFSYASSYVEVRDTRVVDIRSLIVDFYQDPLWGSVTEEVGPLFYVLSWSGTGMLASLVGNLQLAQTICGSGAHSSTRCIPSGCELGLAP